VRAENAEATLQRGHRFLEPTAFGQLEGFVQAGVGVVHESSETSLVPQSATGVEVLGMKSGTWSSGVRSELHDARQVIRDNRAAFTAWGARKAPRTSTDAMVAMASSGDIVCDGGEPEHPKLDQLPRVTQLLQVLAAVVLGSEYERSARDRPVHGGRPGLELAADRSADEVRAVGVEASSTSRSICPRSTRLRLTVIFSLLSTSAMSLLLSRAT